MGFEIELYHMPQSEEHRKIKEIILNQLLSWYGSGIDEYPQSGHDLDNFSVTLSGISMYIEVIWSSGTSNFYRDIRLISRSEADIKIVVVNPEILKKDDLVRDYQKEVIAQRRRGVKIWGVMINGTKLMEDESYLKIEFKQVLDSLLSEVKTPTNDSNYEKKIAELNIHLPLVADLQKTPFVKIILVPKYRNKTWLPVNRENKSLVETYPYTYSPNVHSTRTNYEIDVRDNFYIQIQSNGIFYTHQPLVYDQIRKVIVYQPLVEQIITFLMYAIRIMKFRQVDMEYVVLISLRNVSQFPVVYGKHASILERSNKFSEKKDTKPFTHFFNPNESWKDIRDMFGDLYGSILKESGDVYSEYETVISSLGSILKTIGPVRGRWQTSTNLILPKISMEELGYQS